MHLEIPDPAVNTELQLCISFESNANSGGIVVLAHHADSPTRLSAYYPPGSQCFRAPTAGNYSFAVFTQNGTLEAPATLPAILTIIVSKCKHVFLDLGTPRSLTSCTCICVMCINEVACMNCVSMNLFE